MPIRKIPVITKLTGESSIDVWDFGHAQRISVLDSSAPPHFPCHITGTVDGILVSHGSEMVALPWSVLRPVFEAANPKLVPPPPPKAVDMNAAIEAAKAEASKIATQ